MKVGMELLGVTMVHPLSPPSNYRRITPSQTSPDTANRESVDREATGESLEACGFVPAADRKCIPNYGRLGSRKASLRSNQIAEDKK